MPSDRSIHISYDAGAHEGNRHTRQAIIELAQRAAERAGINIGRLHVLDAGCGVGLLMRDLAAAGIAHVEGLDMDAECVRQASEFGPCRQGDITRLAEIPDQSFDIVVLSHVLEHLQDPISTVRELRRVARAAVIIAVPNPVRPNIVLRHTLRGRTYSNAGHVYSWDRSHFENFLERQCEAPILDWATDEVRIIPTRMLRSTLRRLKLLDRLETKFLPRRVPFLSSSLIVCVAGATDQ